MQKQIKSSASHAHMCQDGWCVFMPCNSRWAWSAHGVFTSWTKVLRISLSFPWLLLWLVTAPPSRWNSDKWAGLCFWQLFPAPTKNPKEASPGWVLLRSHYRLGPYLIRPYMCCERRLPSCTVTYLWRILQTPAPASWPCQRSFWPAPLSAFYSCPCTHVHSLAPEGFSGLL